MPQINPTSALEIALGSSALLYILGKEPPDALKIIALIAAVTSLTISTSQLIIYEDTKGPVTL